MNKELTKKLFNEFPEFFRDRDDYRKTLMGFGFDTDDGWYSIIYQLCKDIKEIVDKDEKLKDFAVLQVKEKFGGLRFYVSFGNDKIFELIRKAEWMSYHTCEVCGKEGQIRVKGGWYKTICQECSKGEWIVVKGFFITKKKIK